VSEYERSPAEFGLPQVAIAAICVDGDERSKAMLLAALDNRQAGAARDIVALNAGRGIYVAGRAASLMDGVAQARARSPAARRAKTRTLSPLQPVHERHPREASSPPSAEEVARPGARARCRSGEMRARCRSHAAAARFRRRAARAACRRRPRGDRRDQEGEPEPGRDPRATSIRPRSPQLRARAARPACRCSPTAVFPGQPAYLRRRAPPAACRCCARISSSTSTRSTRRARWGRTASC
jgi:hypothetical protein